MNTPPDLNDEELQALDDYARDHQHLDTRTAVLARLEQLGLLMRGWNQIYVVTQRGEQVLNNSRTQT